VWDQRSGRSSQQWKDHPRLCNGGARCKYLGSGTRRLMLNTAAPLVVKKRKCDNITPTLRDDLHRLLVRHRVDFKICLLVYKCLHQLAASYFMSLLTLMTAISARRHLRSADLGDLATLRTRTVGFSTAQLLNRNPSAWNSLPSELKNTSLTFGQFTSG